MFKLETVSLHTPYCVWSTLGTALRQLVFLLFINDMLTRTTVPLRLFATTVSFTIKLNQDKTRIKKQCEDRQMAINPIKTTGLYVYFAQQAYAD